MASANGDGFGDSPQGGFAAGASLDVYEAIYRLVMTAYGYRCALTGEQFTPDIGLVHPHLEVVAIRPREAGGPLAIDNYLALEEHAAGDSQRAEAVAGATATFASLLTWLDA